MKKKITLMMLLLLAVLPCKLIADTAFASPGGHDNSNQNAWNADAFGGEPPMSSVHFDLTTAAGTASVITGLNRAFADRGKDFPGKGMPGSGAGNTPSGNHASDQGLNASAGASVPEPTTLAMLGVGCLVFVRKKKV